MTEATVTRALLEHLHKELPAALVRKTSDRFTKGIPDFFVAWDGRTVWFEVKLLRKGETPASRAQQDPLQLLTMRQLHALAGGHAWYLFYDARTRDKCLAVYAPHNLVREEREEFENATAVAGGFDHGAVVRLLEAA